MSDAVDASTRDALQPETPAGGELLEPLILYDGNFDPAGRDTQGWLASFLGCFIVFGFASFLQDGETAALSLWDNAILLLGFGISFRLLPILVGQSVDRAEAKKSRKRAEELRAQLNATPDSNPEGRPRLVASLVDAERKLLRHNRSQDAGTEFIRCCREVGYQIPRTNVHAKADQLDVLRQLSLPSEESDLILITGDRTPYSVWLLILAICIGLGLIMIVCAVDARLVLAYFLFLALAVFWREFRPRRSFPFIRRARRRWRVGPGCMQVYAKSTGRLSRENPIWTAGEAVMVVEQPPWQALSVRFLGERRSPPLRFASIDSPSFIALWQRWNHPRPRPELLDNRPAGQG
jgi:membrane protein implicated in regulation of membrane protease activity